MASGSLGVLAAVAAVLVAGCTVTVPPPVDVRGPVPVIVEPGSAPPPATIPRAY